MTDELHTEEDARMDELEDRTRALAARVEALTAERDAAVKAKEEEKRQLNRSIAAHAVCCDDRSSLRAQVEQLTVERGDYAVKADGSYREVQRLVHQVEQMRGREMALRKLLWLRHGCEITSLYGDDGEMQCPKCGDFRRDEPNAFDERWQAAGLAAIRAALSPSPATFAGFMAEVTAEAEREGPAAVAESLAWGEHFEKEARALSPSPASGVAEKEPSDG